LGSTKRNKKRFAAQQIVMLLGILAHNVVVWTRRWLAVPRLQRYGMVRMVRDVFHVSGFLAFDPLVMSFRLFSIKTRSWLIR
jgi:hypothetical protein